MKFQKSYKNVTAYVHNQRKGKNLHKTVSYLLLSFIGISRLLMQRLSSIHSDPTGASTTAKLALGPCSIPRLFDSKSTKCKNWQIHFFLTWLAMLALPRNSLY